MSYFSRETLAGSTFLFVIFGVLMLAITDKPPRPEIQDMVDAYIDGSPDIQFPDCHIGEVIYSPVGGERKVITLEDNEFALFRKARSNKVKLEEQEVLRQISKGLKEKDERNPERK